jgi:hypothetical protein
MKNKIQNTSGYQGLQKGRQLLPVLDHWMPNEQWFSHIMSRTNIFNDVMMMSALY